MKSSLAIIGISTKNTRQLTGGSLQNRRDAGRGGLQHADQLGANLVEARKRGQGLDRIRTQHVGAHRATDDLELLVAVGESDGDLGGCNRIRRISNRRRTLQELFKT